MGEPFLLIVRRIDLVVLRVLRVAALHAVLLVPIMNIAWIFTGFASIPLANTK
jgi:hypothetical protein